MTRRAQRGRCLGWQGLVSPWLAGLVVAFAVAMQVVHDVSRVMRRSAIVARRLDVARAHLVADAAAVAAITEPAGTQSTAGADVRVAVHRDTRSLVVETRMPNGVVHVFDGRILPGASPAAFARPLSFVSGDTALDHGERIGEADVPRLDPASLATAMRADATPLLRRDPGVAVMRWQAGTDADDFAFVTDSTGRVDLGPVGELLVVPGHLWIEPGAMPLTVRVPRDLVVVVRGNFYIERSLQVQGPGRLLFVTTAEGAGTSFVDADGNGRWSCGEPVLGDARFAGQIEGAGNVYCGGAAAARVESSAGLVAAGELHLLGDASFAGPVVLAHGLTVLRRPSRLHAMGEWCFQSEREAVPGFVAHGASRPSLLQHRATIPVSASTMGQQPLYLSAIVR